MLLAFGILTYAFIVGDFSVRYVAENSNSLLPTYYRVTAVWGAHEGSLLMWALILAAWTAAVALFSRALPQPVIARVLGVMGIVSVGFLAFLIFTSNPFDRLLPGAAEGRDLNPLLQDVGMIFHPPMLYLGYVGFSVPFAFAIAALLDGKVDTRWLRWTRPWTNVAWAFLTIGIALGSWWAYYELGWGGWWFWDPVENASFMPWLVGAALLHSQAVTEKRGSFAGWTLLLAIAAFSLSLLGTFLVRSGVLTSVHAFAADPTRGLFVLIFLGIVIGGSLLLYALRAPSNNADAKPFTACIARNPAAAQQPAADHRLRDGAAGHAVSVAGRCAGARQDFGRPALLRADVPAVDGATGLAAAVRPADPLAARRHGIAVAHADAVGGAGIAAGRRRSSCLPRKANGRPPPA